MEFCNKNKSPTHPEEENNNIVIDESMQYHTPPSHRNEPHTFNLNFPISASISPNHSDN